MKNIKEMTTSQSDGKFVGKLILGKRNFKKELEPFNIAIENESETEQINEDLAVWFGTKKKPKGSKQPKGPWVNICRKVDGKHPPCGRDNTDKGGYPKCRAAGVAGKMSDSEKKAACAQKRRAEKKDTQTGKGQKPVMTSYKKRKSTKESIHELAIMVMKNISENDNFEVSPSTKVQKNICETKKFCSAQGPITFGQLRSIISSATNKRLGIHIGEGGVKALIRLLPWFIPQIAFAGFFGSALRAANKIISPTLKETSSYKTWWAKTILKLFNLVEGEISATDPFSRIFFIGDGLMHLMNEESKIEFAEYISNVVSSQPDDEVVPDFFVENELRNWINKKFLISPPLSSVSDGDRLSETSRKVSVTKSNYGNYIGFFEKDDNLSISKNLNENSNHYCELYYFDMLNHPKSISIAEKFCKSSEYLTESEGGKYSHINFVPPVSVANQASKGLEYRKKAGGKGGLTPSQAAASNRSGETKNLGSGVQRAVNLKNRTSMSPSTVKRMKAFFDRHEKNKSIDSDNKGTPWKDKGYVAWLLWGGDAGYAWARKVVKQMETADKKKKD
jgi:hypothetical protein